MLAIGRLDLLRPPGTGPVEPGDLVASAEHVYRVEVVLWTPPESRCAPVLARRVEPAREFASS